MDGSRSAGYAGAGNDDLQQREWLQELVGIGGDIFQDVFHPAVQDAAQVIDGRCIEGFVFAQLVNGGTGNVMNFDQSIGGFGRCAECIPKTLVNYHINPP